MWSEKIKTLTIGARKGEFPGMVKNRTFRVVWVSEDHGAGAGTVEKPDAIIRYNGNATTVRAGSSW